MKLSSRFALAIFAASLVVLAVSSADSKTASADGGWSLEKFHSDISIQHDGSLLVTETIVANFATAKHGILRDIPVRYAFDASHERIYDLQLRSVTNADGAPWRYVESRAGPNVDLKIGDASRTVTGVQTYVI